MSDDLRAWMETRFDRLDSKLDSMRSDHSDLAGRVLVVETSAKACEARIGAIESKAESDRLRLAKLAERNAADRATMAKTGATGMAGGLTGLGIIEALRALWEAFGGHPK